MLPPRSGMKVLLALVACVVLPGCGADRPPLGTVEGTVTIDGEPLTGVIVAFMPEKGRPATALTDQMGHYRMQYTEGVAGTKVGPNFVVFSAPTTGTTSHPIPAKYLSMSDLKVEVTSGRNTFDFDLEAESEKKPASAKVKQPKAVLD